MDGCEQNISGQVVHERPQDELRSSKRRKTEDLSPSHLAQRALAIVVQQWMLPELYWKIDKFEGRREELKNAIMINEVAKQCCGINPVETDESIKSRLSQHFVNDIYYCNYFEIDNLRILLVQVDVETLFSAGPLSVSQL